MEKAVYLQKEELEKIQEMNSEFTKLKIALGDAELQKYQIINAIDQLKTAFSIQEKELVNKYGADSVINIQTGEVTQKT
ncbi:MAG: hypothetical protein ACK518_03580 [bacterium]|jgi:hypothetical protein